MKKSYFIIILIFALAVDLARAAEVEHSPFPLPVQHLNKQSFFVLYDKRTRVPVYVYERLTKISRSNELDRDLFSFSEDDAIPKPFRATLRDYKGSGFDRGHLSPAADCSGSEEELRDSFLLSNSCPQHPSLNRGYWKKLEKHVRKLTGECDFLEVFTGCLFLPKVCEDGKKRVTYELIGEGSVAVPTHLFKVIRKHVGKEVLEEAYIVPNEHTDKEIPLERFQTVTEEVERWTGLSFRKP